MIQYNPQDHVSLYHATPIQLPPFIEVTLGTELPVCATSSWELLIKISHQRGLPYWRLGRYLVIGTLEGAHRVMVQAKTCISEVKRRYWTVHFRVQYIPISYYQPRSLTSYLPAYTYLTW